MKICFISPKAYPLFRPEIKSVFGGAEVQLFLLAQKISERGVHEVHFMVADYGQDDVEKKSNIYIWKSLNFKHSVFRQAFNFFKVFNKIKADIYIQRNLTLQSPLIALYCKIINKKFVYMLAHDNEADKTHPLFKNMVSSFMIELVFKLSYRVIVQNEYQESYIKKMCKSSKIFLLKKGVDFSKLKEKRDFKSYDAIWVGRCEKWKRPKTFLDLVKNNPDNSFLMICPQATNQQEYFDYIKNLALQFSNLLFVDFIKNNEVYQKLVESRIFIFTSIQEGDWPMTVLEAASSRLPILSYSLNYKGLINDYKGGFFCNGDDYSFDKKFKEIIGDDVLLNKIGDKAFDYINDNHNIDTNCDKFLRIIQ